MLAKSKLNSIETLISQALIDMDISHEEFVTILDEKDKYEIMKDNLRSENEKHMSNGISWKQYIKWLNTFLKIVSSQHIKWNHIV